MLELRAVSGRTLFRGRSHEGVAAFLRSASHALHRRHPTLPESLRFVGCTSTLATADLDDLAAQVGEAGVEGALTPEGRLDLRGIDLPWCDLQKVHAHGVDFTGANLACTALMDADFTGSVLRQADMSGAWMTRGYFCDSDMRGVRMLTVALRPGETMSRNRYRACEIGQVPGDRHRTHGSGACFRGSHLDGAHILDADMKFAAFEGAFLKGATILRSNLEDARFDETDLSRSTVEDCDLRTNSLPGCLTAGASFRRNTYMSWSQEYFSSLWRSARFRKRIRGFLERMPGEMRRDMLVHSPAWIAALYVVLGFGTLRERLFRAS